MTADAVHDFIWHQTTALVAVTCTRCYKHVATWWAQDTMDCDEHPPAEGKWVRDRGTCRCNPPPRLPEGAELAALVEQARTRLDRPRRQGHAPLTHRVTD